MRILAIETSCDDTSLAIFEGDKMLALDTKSQIIIHNLTGGVVPEVAAREHANAIFDVLSQVLEVSKTSIEEIEFIGVTAFPWLIPSLLTWLTLARTLGKILSIPVIELDHIQGHIFSNFLEREENEIPFPLVCLTISGGHNDVYFMNSKWDYERIGTSSDDAAGECFDKVSKMMGLGYPWGQIISVLALEYETKDHKTKLFPRVWLQKNAFDFSFSGLKSAVKREVDARVLSKWFIDEEDKREIAYEFQNAVNEVLAYKLVHAAHTYHVKTILLAGWVSANDHLREMIEFRAQKEWLHFFAPKKKLYCMDNAAMIGILTYYYVQDWKI